MFHKVLLLVSALLVSLATTAGAVDMTVHLSIEKALDNGKVKQALLPGVALYFAGDDHPAITKDFGTFRTSKRTNSFLKDKVDSCEWAFAAAILYLQKTAVNVGGNAVIDITSNVKNLKNPSNIQYDCLTGSMMVNVAFQARVVELAE